MSSWRARFPSQGKGRESVLDRAVPKCTGGVSQQFPCVLESVGWGGRQGGRKGERRGVGLVHIKASVSHHRVFDLNTKVGESQEPGAIGGRETSWRPLQKMVQTGEESGCVLGGSAHHL